MDRRTFLASTIPALILPTLPLPALAQDGARRIVIGQTADLSGAMQNIGRDYFTGAKLVFDQANAGGPTQGRLRFVQVDDGGIPATAAANAKKLIEEEHADVLFGLTSESCVEAVVTSPAFKNSDIELFAPVTGIDHAACKGRAVYLRPSSADEITAVMERMSAMSLTRIALIHSTSPSILVARDAVISSIRSHLNSDAVTTLPLQEGATNVSALISTLEKGNTQAAIFMTDSINASLAIKQIRARMPVLFICLSSTVDAVTVQQMVGPKFAQGLMVSRVVPDPENGLVPIVQEFKRTQKKYLDESLTAAGLEGYIAAQTLLAVLRKSDSPRHLVATAQRRMGVFDLGGWKVDLAAKRAVGRVEIAMFNRDGRLI